MTGPAPRRPFYRRKRWLAAGLVWLAVWYPLSVGPAGYAERRGWLPTKPLTLFYAPAVAAAAAVEPRGGPYAAYLSWWGDVGRRQSAATRRGTRRTVTFPAPPAPPSTPTPASD